MKKHLSSFFILFLLFSCSKKKTEIPQDVISMKEMQLLLTDIHLAQSAASVQILSDSSIYSAKEYVNYVLEDHKISREQFLKSLKFYTENPAILEEVYDSVITELSRIQGESEAR